MRLSYVHEPAERFSKRDGIRENFVVVIRDSMKNERGGFEANIRLDLYIFSLELELFSPGKMFECCRYIEVASFRVDIRAQSH